ncbi:MAG: hypothetical protein Q9213_007954 [Squamulea squamosa]
MLTLAIHIAETNVSDLNLDNLGNFSMTSRPKIPLTALHDLSREGVTLKASEEFRNLGGMTPSTVRFILTPVVRFYAQLSPTVIKFSKELLRGSCVAQTLRHTTTRQLNYQIEYLGIAVLFIQLTTFRGAMSVKYVKIRLRLLSDAHKQTLQLIHRLSKHSVTPGSSPLFPDARLELSTEIHENLKEQEEELELLRQETEDQAISAGGTPSARRRNSGKEREHTELTTQVARLGEDLKLKAQLQAKRSIEAANRKEREQLFTSVQEGASSSRKGRRQGQEQPSKDQIQLGAASDVTAALQRVHSLMQSEVLRSQFALETLHQSTAALSTLSVSYTKLDTLLSSSRSLVLTLLRSQKSDTWYLESAFWVLVITISWLLFRRILYGPGWWLLYLPITVAWRAAVFILKLFYGSLASTADILGATKQSTALGQASGSASIILPEQPSATGELPKFSAGMAAPSIRVDGGGKGQPPPEKPQDERKTMSDVVGEMAETGSGSTSAGILASAEGSQATVLKERAPDEPLNPQKRMWEENVAIQ